MKKSLILIASLTLILSCSSEKQESRLKYEIKEPAPQKTEKKKVAVKYSELKPLALTSTPAAIAIDSKDNILVAGKNMITSYSRDLKLLGSANIRYRNEITALVIDNNGTIYAAIKDAVAEITGGLSGKITITDIDKNSWISSIAIVNDNLFFADAGNRVVLRYSKDMKLLNRIAEKDEKNGIPGLIVPSPYMDVVRGLDNDIWVVNPGRHALENYTPEGKLISSWERSSFSIEGFCGCCNPSHIALLKDGSFVTSEKGLPRLKIHEPTGDLRVVVAGTEKFYEETKGMDIAINSSEEIFIIDPVRKQVRIFRKSGIGVENGK